MNKELEFLIDVVRSAEEISKEHFVVSAKGTKGDLITNLDVKIEKFLISKIKQAYPTFDIVSEEMNSKKQVTESCFVIDPIDGTVNFASGVPLWTIQVACIKNGKVVASVVSLPKIGEFFYADETTAFLNGEKIKVGSYSKIADAMYSIDGSNNVSAIKKMKKYASHSRNYGAVGVSQVFVSCGRLHGTVYRSNKVWDYLPGMHIAKMAGAVVVDELNFHASACNQEMMDLLQKETKKPNTKSNIVILCGLNGETYNYWGKDIQQEFEVEREIKVHMPKLPIRKDWSYEAVEKVLLEYMAAGKLTSNSIVVAHSISNSNFLRFVREQKFYPKAFIMVAPNSVYPYELTRDDYVKDIAPKNFNTKEDIVFARKNLKNLICVYSNEGSDDRFKKLIKETGAKEVYLDGYFHFDNYHQIYKIPELNEIILEELNK